MSRIKIRKFNTGGTYPGEGANTGITGNGASQALVAGANTVADSGVLGGGAWGAAATGALSGAAMGASIGGPWGAAIGGVVGGTAGYLKGKKGEKEQEEAMAQLMRDRKAQAILQQQQIANNNVQNIQYAGYRQGGKIKLWKR